jgi:hypothetical protein
MLETVGHPYAVNPDRALRREAAVRGWPVLEFTPPAPLRRRLAGRLDHVAHAPASAVVPAAAAAGALAVTAVLWLVLRRRPFPVAA